GNVTEPKDLENPGLKVVVAAEDVPVGQYTRQMLDNMSADSDYGSDFRSQVEANFVSQESDVKQVVAKVQLGEADAGVVYVTDVTADVQEDVMFIEVPEELNVIAEYPIALVTNGDAAVGQAFIDYVLSPAGQAVLEAHGFTPLP